MSDREHNLISANGESYAQAIWIPEYLTDLCAFLATHRQPLWDEASALIQSADTTQTVISEAQLLSRVDAKVPYLQCEALQKRMGLELPVALYRESVETSVHARLMFDASHVRIIVSDRWFDAFSESEVEAILASQLARYALLSHGAGEFAVLDHLLAVQFTTGDVNSVEANTTRRYLHWRDVCCDRHATQFLDAPHNYLQAVVRSETGASAKEVEHWLRDADQGDTSDGELSTCERQGDIFLRLLALQNKQNSSLTEGAELGGLHPQVYSLQSLDVVQQQRIFEATAHLIRRFLDRSWLRTPTVLNYVESLFGTKDVTRIPSEESLISSIDAEGTFELQRYFCAVLLDLASIDPVLQEPALAAAYLLADDLKLDELFHSMVATELNLGTKFRERVRENAQTIVMEAAELSR